MATEFIYVYRLSKIFSVCSFISVVTEFKKKSSMIENTSKGNMTAVIWFSAAMEICIRMEAVYCNYGYFCTSVVEW